MAKRHGTWTFTGERTADGRPLRFFHGIPARDLTPRDIDRLDDDQYATVEASDLYEQKAPAKNGGTSTTTKKATSKRTPAKRTAAKDTDKPAEQSQPASADPAETGDAGQASEASTDGTSGKE